jgi:hypothetical protein
MNIYAYAGNDPINHTDPTGTRCRTYVVPLVERNVDNDSFITLVTGTYSYSYGQVCFDEPPEPDFGGGSGGGVPDSHQYGCEGAFAPGLMEGAAYSVYVPGGCQDFIDRSERKTSPIKPLAKCAVKQFGLDEVLGATMMIAGQPLIPKAVVRPGESDATSIAAKVSRGLLGNAKLPFPMPAPTNTTFFLRGEVPMTRFAGKFVGRAIPLVGEAILAADGLSILGCAVSGGGGE